MVENEYKIIREGESVIYRLISGINSLIRIIILPNPFEGLGDGIFVSLFNADILLIPTFLNILIEPLLKSFTYVIVGLYYSSNSTPTLGSILYLIFYILHIGLLQLISNYGFDILASSLILIGYIACHMFIKNVVRMDYKF